MNKIHTSNTISLRELREQLPKYIDAIANGQSFTVVKRSKPIFQLSPISDDGIWQTIVDFTTVDSKGVDADAVLKALD